MNNYEQEGGPNVLSLLFGAVLPDEIVTRDEALLDPVGLPSRKGSRLNENGNTYRWEHRLDYYVLKWLVDG